MHIVEDEPQYIDHFKVVRQLKTYDHIIRRNVDVSLYVVEDTENNAILIRIWDHRIHDDPIKYGTHFFCDDLTNEKQEWLANVIAGAMVDVLVTSTKQLQKELRKRFKEFTVLLGM